MFRVFFVEVDVGAKPEEIPPQAVPEISRVKERVGGEVPVTFDHHILNRSSSLQGGHWCQM